MTNLLITIIKIIMIYWIIHGIPWITSGNILRNESDPDNQDLNPIVLDPSTLDSLITCDSNCRSHTSLSGHYYLNDRISIDEIISNDDDISIDIKDWLLELIQNLEL